MKLPRRRQRRGRPERRRRRQLRRLRNRDGRGAIAAFTIQYCLGCSCTLVSSCPDGTKLVDGVCVAEGPASCTVADNEDGTAVLSCPDGTETTISTASCTVIVGEDGTQTLSCGDGTSLTVSGGVVGGTSLTVGGGEEPTSLVYGDPPSRVVTSDGIATRQRPLPTAYPIALLRC